MWKTSVKTFIVCLILLAFLYRNRLKRCLLHYICSSGDEEKGMKVEKHIWASKYFSEFNIQNDEKASTVVEPDSWKLIDKTPPFTVSLFDCDDDNGALSLLSSLWIEFVTVWRWKSHRQIWNSRLFHCTSFAFDMRDIGIQKREKKVQVDEIAFSNNWNFF